MIDEATPPPPNDDNSPAPARPADDEAASNSPENASNDPTEMAPPVEAVATPDETAESHAVKDEQSLPASTDSPLAEDRVADGSDAVPTPQSPSPTEKMKDQGEADQASSEAETEVPSPAKPDVPDWSNECSPQRIAGELKHIEKEIREVLDGRESKRRRKLGGTRRWLELQENLIGWHYHSRIDKASLVRLEQLIARRHHLFHRLTHLTSPDDSVRRPRARKPTL